MCGLNAACLTIMTPPKSKLWVCSSPLEHGDIAFPLLSAPGWAGPCVLKMPIIVRSSQPMCNYALLADNDPPCPHFELILLRNMPDGDSWRKVIGQWCWNSLHWETGLRSLLHESPLPECETAVVIRHMCRRSLEKRFVGFSPVHYNRLTA